MVIKNINAVLALVTAFVLALHNIVNARMMMLGRVLESPKMLAHILMVCVIAHALISMFVLIFRNEGGKPKYVNISPAWLIQRITAIALIPLVLFHGMVNVGEYGFGLMAILIVHFFIMLLAYIHIPLSVPNALVTLGIIDNSKQHKKVSCVCWIICALLFLFGLAASLSEVIVL